jgi:hypothetical protein
MRIFGPKREEVAGGWRRLHDEKLHSLYASLNIIRIVKSRRVRWERHVTRMGAMKMHKIFCLENLKRKHHSQDLGIDGRILERILQK